MEHSRNPGDSNTAVLPSPEEGLAVSILGAMSAGKPMTASAMDSIPGGVEEARTRFLVPLRDAAVRARVLSDGELGMKLGRAGIELVQGRYGAKAIDQDYQAFYEQI